MIGSLVGLVATLLALVLGLLIWTSHGVFTAQQSQLELIAHSIARLHFKLKAYGAEATSADALLYEQALRARARFWAEDARGRDDVPSTDVPASGMAMRVALTSLRPTSDEQRQHLAAAKELCNTVFETQLTMLRSLVNPVPSLLLNVVLSWSCILFFSYGLLSVINALTAIMAALARSGRERCVPDPRTQRPLFGPLQDVARRLRSPYPAHIRGRREEDAVLRIGAVPRIRDITVGAHAVLFHRMPHAHALRTWASRLGCAEVGFISRGTGRMARSIRA